MKIEKRVKRNGRFANEKGNMTCYFAHWLDRKMRVVHSALQQIRYYQHVRFPDR